MKKFSLVLFLTVSIAFSSSISRAQYLSRSVVANSAESFSNATMSMTYVLGEFIGDLLPNTAANFTLTAGFDQPDVEIQNVLNSNFSSALIIYPNPANGPTVKLAFNHVPDGVYTVNLVDAAGRILQSQTVTYANQNFLYLPIDVSRLPSGVYFISVINQLNFQGQVKLIKI